MPKRNSRGRRSSDAAPAADGSQAQPCCILGCERFGTRLLTSLRASYQLKEDHSGRVCEGHYRRDLRKYKKNSELDDVKTRLPTRKGSLEASSSSEPESMEEKPFRLSYAPYPPVPSSVRLSSVSAPVVQSPSTSSNSSNFPMFKQHTEVVLQDYAETEDVTNEAGVHKFKLFCEFVLKSESVI